MLLNDRLCRSQPKGHMLAHVAYILPHRSQGCNQRSKNEYPDAPQIVVKKPHLRPYYHRAPALNCEFAAKLVSCKALVAALRTYRRLTPCR